MISGKNKIDNKLDEHILFMQYLVDTNKKVNDELKKKLNKHDSGLYKIKTLHKQVLVQNQIYSPDKMDSPKAQYPTNVVPANKKAPPLEGGNSTKIGGM